ncbi:hypothetical protein [Streptomyces sp. NPDC007206]|uniref:hypothetical protein n=1 Tax=Streptomyces sp. NPDC007206 TaxID=3154317 RepID=UPI0033E7BFA3
MRTANLARAAVPIGEHELGPDATTPAPGTVLAGAARLLAAAQRFFEAAAVFERVVGADWLLIGKILNVAPRTARVHFGMAETAFRQELSSPEGISSREAAGVTSLRAHMTREPPETALDLDNWLLRHQDGDDDLGSAPVCEGLVRRKHS